MELSIFKLICYKKFKNLGTNRKMFVKVKDHADNIKLYN